eukprot:491543-Rhodomonas_salina.2
MARAQSVGRKSTITTKNRSLDNQKTCFEFRRVKLVVDVNIHLASAASLSRYRSGTPTTTENESVHCDGRICERQADKAKWQGIFTSASVPKYAARPRDSSAQWYKASMWLECGSSSAVETLRIGVGIAAGIECIISGIALPGSWCLCTSNESKNSRHQVPAKSPTKRFVQWLTSQLKKGAVEGITATCNRWFCRF